MYLKRVDITGFKSFAEKTKLYFEPGITAVVGPNGCGKSNVVDAVRWCLGEHSMRSLRCQNMLDIIFNGSQKRSPMGMSEVSLVFDNTSNKIPLDFSEVTVTRKLFRSGESEYYLNKVQCRLKDIRDLFLDTGIGYEGYSIMEQGKIDFILNAKPEERREMFEEAAGVSKYKARRDESLRKMEKIQFDLMRIQDTVGMVKDQIRQLDLASRKAKQYKSGMEELKNIEIADYLYQKGQIDDSIVSIFDMLNKTRDAAVALTVSVDKEEAGLENLRLNSTEREKTFSDIQAAAYKIDSEIALCENRAETARKKSEELIERKEQLFLEINAASGKLEEVVLEYKQLLNDTDSLSHQEQTVSGELKAKELILETETINKTEKENLSRDLKTSLYEKESKKTELQNNLFQVSSKISRVTGEQFSLEKEYAKKAEFENTSTSRMQLLQQKYNTAQKLLETLQMQHSESSAQLHEIEGKVAQFQQREDEINQKQLKICARLSALSELLDTDPYHKGAMALLSKEWKGICGPVHRLIRFSEEYRYIISDGLGDSLSYFVSETIAEAEEALNFLKREGLGRARFFILETLPHEVSLPLKFITSEKSLLSVLEYDPRIESLLRHLLHTTYFKGTTIYRDNSIEGGVEYLPDTYTVGSGTLREKDALEHQLTELNKKRTENKSAIDIFVETSEQLKSKLIELETAIKEAEISSSLAGTELQKNIEEKKLLDDEIKIIYSDLQGFFDRKKDFISVKSTDNEQCLNLEHEIEHMRRNLARVEAELSSSNEYFSAVINETNQIRIRHSQLAERIQHKKYDKERIEIQHLDMAQVQVQKESVYSNSERLIIEQQNLYAEEQNKINALFREKEVQDGLVRDAAEERNRLQTEIHSIIEKLHILRQESNNANADAQRIEIEHQKLLFKEKNLAQNLFDKYGVDFEQVKLHCKAEPIVSEKFSKLKNRLDNMGSVNLAAPEEYAQLEGRYNFLQNQYNDIINAKEDLQKVIKKINATTKENFIKTFYQVQENFKKVYQILFQGGEAKLTLTNEENLLETGVDIFAQPPGKKLQNISLLSGGEKALTAAALLFAFFMVRPSPLCILDEVDAPMDEANVGRFIRLIRDFSKETQFLIITHNKRTMEIADILYGVTMEEYGVSKVISIRFNEKMSAQSNNVQPAELTNEPSAV